MWREIMMGFFSKISIRQKILLGSGLVLSMLVVVSLVAIVSLTSTQTNVVKVVEERQP